MSRAAVDYALFLADQAFDGDEEHSLMGNLREVAPEDWRSKHPGGERTIRSIVLHAGVAKYVCADHLFGSKSLAFLDTVRAQLEANQRADIDGWKAWLREGHRQFREGLATLEATHLDEPDTTHWGAVMQRKQIIGIMIQHDAYHAGEINHLRALLHGDDNWWPEYRAVDQQND